MNSVSYGEPRRYTPEAGTLRAPVAVLCLVIIIGIAAGFRLTRLSTIPNTFEVDEASTGYDAFSLLETGRDQYGAFLPLFTRSLGDYDEALYRYLAVPSIRVFGLNEFATRLPAALIGIITVGLMYPLTREFADRVTALLAALLLAVNPVHVQNSRLGLRGILLPFTLCLATWLFLSGLRRPRRLLLAGAAFGLSLWTYAAARVFVPMFVAGLVLIWWRDLTAHPRYALLGGGLFLTIIAALAGFWLSPQGMSRGLSTLDTRSSMWALNYISYFSPKYLFWSGTNSPMLRPPNVGNLLMIELLTIPAGLAILARRPWRDRTHRLLWLWILLYPVPAFLTAPQHSMRTIAATPLFAILSAFGIVALAACWKTRRRWAVGIIAFALITNIALYAKLFFVDYANLSSRWWQYGMGRAVRFAEAGATHTVYVSDRFFIPHIFILFYSEYPPAVYQADPLQSIRQRHWFYTNVRLGRYQIVPIFDRRSVEGDALFVLREDEFEKFKTVGYDLSHVETLRDPGGVARIRLVTVHDDQTVPSPIKLGRGCDDCRQP